MGFQKIPSSYDSKCGCETLMERAFSTQNYLFTTLQSNCCFVLNFKVTWNVIYIHNILILDTMLSHQHMYVLNEVAYLFVDIIGQDSIGSPSPIDQMPPTLKMSDPTF